MRTAGWRLVAAASVLGALSAVGLVGTSGVGAAASAHQVPVLPALGPIYTSSPGPTSVIIDGSIDPNGSATTYVFNFGTTTAYGSTTTTGSAGGGTALVTVSATLTGLTPGTVYHADLVVTNSAGTVTSGDLRFTTATSSTTTTPGPPPPPPVAAQSLETVAVANPAGAFDSLNAVSCVAPSFCVAVGFAGRGTSQITPLIERWSGSSFATVASPATSGAALSGVACSSDANCLAVGRVGLNAYAEHWNGHAWRVVATPSPRTSGNDILNGAACPTSASCWAVGLSNGGTPALSTLVEHWDGRVWRVVSTPSPAGSELAGVSCATAIDCWAVGAADAATSFGTARPLSEQWNGRVWRVQSMPGTSGQALAVTCDRTGTCWATMTARNAAVLGLERGSWQRVTTPPRASYDALTCASAHDCWAVDGGGALWNGRSWAPATVAANAGVLLGVSCLTTDRCVAVGVTGTAITTQRATAVATRPW